MKTRVVLGFVVMILLLVQVGNAAGKEDIQKYFNDTARKVKETTNPVEKREILTNSLQTMTKALERVENSGLVSEDDLAGIDQFRTALQDKQDELTGRNGFERVPDGQLNAFSDYVIQDMEQADKTITISVVTALLIVIILLLIS